MPDLAPDNSLGFHRFLLAETKNRLDLYQQAIAQTLKAGDIVLDLGAGMGILSFLACQAGAGKVYAVEVTDVAEYAKLLAMANGLEERITFLQDLSFRVNLPEPVDLLVADIFSTFGLQAGGLAAVIDARQRLLKSGAAIIPNALELFIVPVEVPEVYVKEVDIWATTLMGMDLSPVRRFAVNNTYPIRLEPEHFLGDPASFAQFQLATLASPRVGGEVSIRTLRDGVLHGLGGWFQATLAKDIVVSNQPGAASTNYAQIFFPLSRPITLNKGDQLKIVIDSFDSAQWRWQVEINGASVAGGPPTPREVFDHMSLLGAPFSQENLRKRAANNRPTLSSKGLAQLFVLESFSGEKTVTQVANDLHERFPEHFPTLAQASAFVRDVVDKST